MLKNLVAAAAVAGSLAAFGSVAEAKTHVTIGVGIGAPGCYGYDCNYQPDWQPGYGVYDGYGSGYDGYDGPRYRHDAIFMDNYVSCKEAAWNLRADGWHNVRTRSCRGFIYTFNGVRGYTPGIVRVDGRTGEIISVRWLR